MSKKEIIVQELASVPEKDLDALLGFIHSLKSGNAEDTAPLAALSGDDIILCQITSQAKSDEYSVVLDASDFESGGLNLPSRIRPNRLFTADSRIALPLAEAP